MALRESFREPDWKAVGLWALRFDFQLRLDFALSFKSTQALILSPASHPLHSAALGPALAEIQQLAADEQSLSGLQQVWSRIF